MSTFEAVANACIDALDLSEYTRAMLCEVVIGVEVLPNARKEEQLPIRVIAGCESLFNCLRVPEDRGTAYDSGVSARKVFDWSGKRPETLRADVGRRVCICQTDRRNRPRESS